MRVAGSMDRPWESPLEVAAAAVGGGGGGGGVGAAVLDVHHHRCCWHLSTLAIVQRSFFPPLLMALLLFMQPKGSTTTRNYAMIHSCSIHCAANRYLGTRQSRGIPKKTNRDESIMSLPASSNTLQRFILFAFRYKTENDQN